MENDTVVATRPVFYHKFVDDIYMKRKKNTQDKLYHSLNNYHKNIKLTIEVSPTKFLGTIYLIKMELTSLKDTEKKPKHQHTGHHAFPKDMRETV